MEGGVAWVWASSRRGNSITAVTSAGKMSERFIALRIIVFLPHIPAVEGPPQASSATAATNLPRHRQLYRAFVMTVGPDRLRKT